MAEPTIDTDLQRVRCCFEQASVVQGKQLLLDFATVRDGQAQLLTEGLAHKMEATQIKAARERGFPLELMEKGYEVDIRSAEASKAEDKQHILNSIAGKELSSEPDLSSPESQGWTFGSHRKDRCNLSVVRCGSSSLSDA